ncbi:MAG: hypothetical protein QM817_31920 [Archangium sp.]
MIAIVAALVLAQQSPVSVEGSGAYSASLRPAYGGFVGGSYAHRFSELWIGEAGALIGYQAEPYDVFDQYLGGAHSFGATHRLQVLGTLGPRFEVWRFTLSPHLLIGWSKVWLDGRFVNEKLGIDGKLVDTVSAFTLGLGASIAFRIVGPVHAKFRALAPLPFASGVTGYITFSLGVLVEL